MRVYSKFELCTIAKKLVKPCFGLIAGRKFVGVLKSFRSDFQKTDNAVLIND